MGKGRSKKSSYKKKSRAVASKRNLPNKLKSSKTCTSRLRALQSIENNPTNEQLEYEPLPELEVEMEEDIQDQTPFDQHNIGRRIVDMSYFFQELRSFDNHSLFGCGFKDMEVIKETRKGLISTFELKCKMCGWIKKISTECEKTKMNMNSAAVLATLSTGCGHSQMTEQQAIMNIPQMSYRQYAVHNEIISNSIYKASWEAMQEAGKEELQLAKDIGEVDSQGNGLITVIVDGVWSKRSYKVNYNALSGVACIIGAKTGKILYVASKDKYCPICARASSKSEEPQKHSCSKNWSGSSTAMESAIILEGFKNSVGMHKLKYIRLVGDGDSSVYKKICETRPYGPVSVTKVECTNHLLRNYCTHLRELTSKKKSSADKQVKPELRKILSARILKLRIAIKSAILHHRKNTINFNEQVQLLSADIKNCPFHVFGRHNKCADYFCKKEKIDEDYVTEMESCGLMEDIVSAGNRLLQNTQSLILNMNNNAAETYNSVVAKFVGGKRINFASKGGYGVRCKAAAVSYNKRENYISTLCKNITSQEVGKHSQTFIVKLKTKRNKRALRGPQIKKKRITAPADKEYGMPEQEILDLEGRKKNFLDSLPKTKEEILEIEIKTRGQASNTCWKQYRSNMLTASNFGTICKLRKTTDPKKTVQNILFSSFTGSKATDWGKENERHAKKAFEEKFSKEVKDCGLFIYDKLPFLGASPDGVINADEIIEIKCPFSCAKMTPEMGVTEGKIKYLQEKQGAYSLKRTHNYFYQLQGQLAITGAKYCYFIVWTPLGIITEKIERDDKFWELVKPKLEDFYLKHILEAILKNSS